MVLVMVGPSHSSPIRVLQDLQDLQDHLDPTCQHLNLLQALMDPWVPLGCRDSLEFQ